MNTIKVDVKSNVKLFLIICGIVVDLFFLIICYMYSYNKNVLIFIGIYIIFTIVLFYIILSWLRKSISFFEDNVFVCDLHGRKREYLLSDIQKLSINVYSERGAVFRIVKIEFSDNYKFFFDFTNMNNAQLVIDYMSQKGINIDIKMKS